MYISIDTLDFLCFTFLLIPTYRFDIRNIWFALLNIGKRFWLFSMISFEANLKINRQIIIITIMHHRTFLPFQEKVKYQKIGWNSNKRRVLFVDAAFFVFVQQRI